MTHKELIFDKQEQEKFTNLVYQLKKDLKSNNCYRDLLYAVLSNFPTEDILEHILTDRCFSVDLIKKINEL